MCSVDVIVPTYRRPALLRRTLNSLLTADRPAGVTARIIVVDNDPDGSARETTGLHVKRDVPIVWLRERRAGKSHALNTGVAASTADLVAFIDDDEEVGAAWFAQIAAEFEAPGTDYIGGRVVAVWHAEWPHWRPEEYPAVVGIVESGPSSAAYGPGFHGILTGGNAVLTRAILQKVGPFSPALGPRADRRLFSCEDEDLYLRLLDAGARGRYVPDLVVYHHVHPERLTKRYYRRWCFWRGVSKAILSRRRAEPVAHVGGVPRYLLGRGGRGFATLLRKTLALGPAKDRFAAELTMWDLAGFVYGRHFYTDRTGFEAEHATDVTLSARSAKAPLVSAG